jgi:hypothetical protein
MTRHEVTRQALGWTAALDRRPRNQSNGVSRIQHLNVRHGQPDLRGYAADATPFADSGRATQPEPKARPTFDRRGRRWQSCIERHPTWPLCPDAVAYPSVTAHEYLIRECPRRVRFGTLVLHHCEPVGGEGADESWSLIQKPQEGPTCKAGGTQFHCYLWDGLAAKIRYRRPISVRCCNCCSSGGERSVERIDCSEQNGIPKSNAHWSMRGLGRPEWCW